MKRTVLCVTELEHTNAVFVSALRISSEESANVQLTTCHSPEIWKQAADQTTPPQPCATIEEIVSAGSASATHERTVRKWYPENIASVTTSRVIDTMENSALEKNTENVTAETASVKVSGTWKDTQLASAKPVITPASPPTESISESCALAMGSASVASASARRLRKDNIQENTAKTAQPARESARS